MIKLLFYKSVWLAAGSATGRIVPLGFLFWTSTFFTNQQYSSLSTILMLTTVFTTLVASGISNVLTHRIAGSLSNEDQTKIIFTFYMGMLFVATIFSMLCFYAGAWAFSMFFEGAVSSGLHAPTALAAWAWPQIIFFMSALNGLGRTKEAGFLVGGAGIAQGLAMLLAQLVFGANVDAIAWGFAIGCLCASAFSVILLLRASQMDASRLFSWSNFDFSLLNETKFAVILNTVASASIMPVSFLAGVQIAKADNGSAQLAQFYFLEQINQVLVYFPAIFGQILIPVISRRLGGASATDAATVIRYTCRVIIQLFIFSTFLAALGILFSPYLLAVVKTPQLGPDATWAFNWMLYNALLTLPLTVLGAALVSSGHIIFGSLSNMFWGACVLFLTYQFAQFGNAGFQASRVAASTLLLIVSISFLLIITSRYKIRGNSL
jgi:O-antigen/teichoic acid export membrane protein